MPYGIEQSLAHRWRWELRNRLSNQTSNDRVSAHFAVNQAVRISDKLR